MITLFHKKITCVTQFQLNICVTPPVITHHQQIYKVGTPEPFFVEVVLLSSRYVVVIS
jgi:hypothetical protein